MITLLLLACGSDPAPASDELSSARYTWTWSTPSSAEPTEGGWAVHTDEGYVVELHEARVVAYSVWIDPCPRPREVGLLDLLVSSAVAGHSVMSNPTASHAPVVVDWMQPGTVVLDPLTFEADRYCRVGALHARGDNWTGPDAHDMHGTTLRLVGRWERDGVSRDFDLSTPIAHSVSAPLEADGVGPHLDLTVRQSLDGVFDGIDFAEEPEARVLRSVLANLVDSTQLTAHRTLSP